MTTTIQTILATTAAMLAWAGCSAIQSPQSIVGTAAASPDLSTLAKLVGDAGLSDILNGPGPFTVFAPSDEAFRAMPTALREALSHDKELLREVLSYHVLPGKLMMKSAGPGNVPTVQGKHIPLARAGTAVQIGDASVLQADVSAANGVVHVISKVLFPPKVG